MIRSIALALLGTVAVLGGLRLLTALAETDFRVVRVEGELTAGERDQVRAAIAAGLHRAGAPSVADVVHLVKSLGWVREVRARRHWPHALHVVVRRETPVARWGRDAWLSTSGGIIPGDQLAEAPGLAALPRIDAAHADGAGAMEVFDRIGAVAAAEGMRIVALAESKAGDWTATLADGTQAVLGRTALRERMERFAVVYRAHLRPLAGAHANAPSAGALPRADARYANGVAVRWVARPDSSEVDDPPLAGPTFAAAAALSSRASGRLGARDGE